MAKGFAAGLVQGALVCGVGLAALSLALPQPVRTGGAEVAVVVPPVPEPQPPEAAMPIPAPQPATPTPPIAADLAPPEGSAFARGEDVAPQAPAPLIAADAPKPIPPAMTAPTDEVTPATAEPTAQPEARGDAPIAPVMQPPAPDPVDLPQLALDAPLPVPPPGRVQTPGLDRMPETVAGQGAVDMPATLPASTAQVEEVSVPEANPSDTAPATEAVGIAETDQAKPAAAAPGQGFDLSTPPDFGALRLTPRTE